MAKQQKPGAAEPKAAAPVVHDPGSKIPSLEEVVAAGYDLRAAHGIVAREEALDAGMSVKDAEALAEEAMKDFDARKPEPAPEPAKAEQPKATEPAKEAAPAAPEAPAQPKRKHLRIMSVGTTFRRCGRTFTNKAIDIPLDELTPEEIQRLTSESKEVLKVMHVEL